VPQGDTTSEYSKRTVTDATMSITMFLAKVSSGTGQGVSYSAVAGGNSGRRGAFEWLRSVACV